MYAWTDPIYPPPHTHTQTHAHSHRGRVESVRAGGVTIVGADGLAIDAPASSLTPPNVIQVRGRKREGEGEGERPPECVCVKERACGQTRRE